MRMRFLAALRGASAHSCSCSMSSADMEKPSHSFVSLNDVSGIGVTAPLSRSAPHIM